MKNNAKSSITLPPEELDIVNQLMKKLKAKSKVDVVRRGLKLLKESTDRASLRSEYKKASTAVRASNSDEMKELDATITDGLKEW